MNNLIKQNIEEIKKGNASKRILPQEESLKVFQDSKRLISFCKLVFCFLLLLQYISLEAFAQSANPNLRADTLDVSLDSLNQKKLKLLKNPVGNEFWLCFQRNYKETGNLSSDQLILELFITGDWDAKVRIEIPSTRFHHDTLVPGQTVVTVRIPPQSQVLSSEKIEKLAVHVISDNPISVYGLNRRFQTTDTYLGLPVEVLGTEYRAMCYTESKGLVSQVAVVATENSTKVSIVPSTNTISHPKGIEFSINLNKGDVYQLISKLETFSDCDLTGSLIKSNKKIAVFSGHQCSYVPKSIIACNHLVEQVPPIPSWGRHFYLGGFKSRLRYTYRVLAHHDSTRVFINNELVSELKAGQHFERIDNRNIQLSATRPVLVAQYSHGMSDGDSVGDPMMILVSPTQQFLKTYRFATPVSGSWNHFINVIVPTNAINAMRLNGRMISSSDFEQIGISRYSLGQINVPFGTHTITGSEPFGMYSYGFGYKGPVKDDAYDAYGTMGGQSFIEYEIELDSLPPTADIKYYKDSTILIVRDDRIDDSGIREVRILDNFGIEAIIDNVMIGMPQSSLKLVPAIPEVPGRVVIETIDVALNKSLFTVCYKFDVDNGQFNFFLSEGTNEDCEVDPGIQLGAFGNLSGNINIADFSSSDGLHAGGKFSEGFNFGGYGGLIIGRQIQDKHFISARILFENNPALLNAPDSTIEHVRDSLTHELKDYQQQTDLKFNGMFLSVGFAYEWFLTEGMYIFGGLNGSFPLSKEIEVTRKILTPDEWTYPGEKREMKDPAAPSELSSINSFRFSLFWGTGFSFNINYRLSLFGEVLFNHYFNSMIDDGDWSLEQIKLNLGFRYRFYLFN
ncbi:MAG: IgGFc-binding protein [bacterium]